MRFYFKTFLETLDLDSPLSRLEYFVYSLVSSSVLGAGTVALESFLSRFEPSAPPEMLTGPFSLIFIITLVTATLKRLKDAGKSLWLIFVPGISLIQFAFPTRNK